MAICYCGCGLRIGAFATGRKSANKMGAVVRQVRLGIEEHVHLASGVSLDDPNVRSFSEKIATTKEEAAWLDEECQEVVHEEKPFGAVDWPLMRSWVRETQGMVGFFALPREHQQRIVSG